MHALDKHKSHQSKYDGQSGQDDCIMALALITVWAIRTGRELRLAPVSELSAEELVAFWADDQLDGLGDTWR